jgi:D-lactate dehydrogenase
MPAANDRDWARAVTGSPPRRIEAVAGLSLPSRNVPRRRLQWPAVDLARELTRLLPAERVLTRAIDRVAFANDASVYRLVPRAVVMPASIAEVQALFGFARRHGIGLTFRAAGTSLSGQAVTDAILVVVSRHWRQARVEDGGRRVRVQPGVIGGRVNELLRPHRARIGPDPASINACMIGGILANNSSGMCCGVAQNAYHTLASMTLLLPDGLLVDSAAPGAADRFRRERPQLARGLLALRRRIEDHPTLGERIRAKHRMKNTTGYSLNAFVDFGEPLDILTHLMIGSEGTLGFIAEAVLDTVPDHPEKYTGLLFFEDVARACAAIAPLRDSGARALELMDRASLRAVQDRPGVPGLIRGLGDACAALLVEHQCATPEELEQSRAACAAVLPSLPLCAEPLFTRDPERQAALWRVRKGLIPSVGAMRRPRTSFIIEDVVFPVERLADGVRELQGLFATHGYDDAIVFGHAKDGNLHFVLTQAFERPADVERYDAFMHALADLVVGRHDGALKAEHGTGRNMAPFVATEWGEDALGVMWDLKRLVDPDAILNPGVILDADPRAHVLHLKDLPAVEAEVDPCIECGFCERVCPSRDLTLTPRQRIVVRREMARLRAVDPRSPVLAEIEADYAYDGIATCAGDGLCVTACPVGIDTGALMKRLRGASRSARAHALAAWLAQHFALVERAARHGLRAGGLAAAVLARRLPAWGADMPRARTGRLPRTPAIGARAVYFPSCPSRVLAPAGPHEPDIARLIPELAARAGLPLWLPERAAGHCCGLPFTSKGFGAAGRRAAERTLAALAGWSDRGRLPVVIDTSPCAYTLLRALADGALRERAGADGLRILDGIEFAHDLLLPRLEPRRLAGAVALHPVCSVQKMDLVGKLTRIAEACCERADVPASAGCCGFAGDLGFTLPELTAAATREEALELAAGSHRGHYSSSRTCEIGLSRATGRPYRSFWSLLDEATRPASGLPAIAPTPNIGSRRSERT